MTAANVQGGKQRLGCASRSHRRDVHRRSDPSTRRRAHPFQDPLCQTRLGLMSPTVNQAAHRAGTATVTAIVHGTTVRPMPYWKVRRENGAVDRGVQGQLETRRLGRPGVYDVFWERNPPLVPRRARMEVPERMHIGEVLTPLDPEAWSRQSNACGTRTSRL